MTIRAESINGKVKSKVQNIETYYVPFDELPIKKISTSSWLCTKVNSNAGGVYDIKKVWDGNPNTFWSSSWKPFYPLPYVIEIDMQKKYDIRKVVLQQRPKMKDLTKLTIDLSEDGENWVNLGEFTKGNIFNQELGGKDELVYKKGFFFGQFLRITIPESGRGGGKTSVCIAEIEVHALQ
ncbi:discoidin domain-containing protein [Halosquirtibacter laminarini]|uniref:Discoidin domain-containing protein n=1 Tax=Halosquirtibacter laminarini TaxID=3374600 RepID=A0AC61NPR7_9BACT|nr:discoidin domain-containing protein [Prolixibacteraceae bacterium]